MSATWVRARPAMIGPSTVRAMAWTASKSPGEVIGNPASMTSTPRRASCWAISSFSCVLSEMPGDCSPSRSVVSKISTRLGSSGGVMSLPLLARTRTLLGAVVRGYVRPPTRYSPRGGRRRSRRARLSDIRRKRSNAFGEPTESERDRLTGDNPVAGDDRLDHVRRHRRAGGDRHRRQAAVPGGVLVRLTADGRRHDVDAVPSELGADPPQHAGHVSV